MRVQPWGEDLPNIHGPFERFRGTPTAELYLTHRDTLEPKQTWGYGGQRDGALTPYPLDDKNDNLWRFVRTSTSGDLSVISKRQQAFLELMALETDSDSEQARRLKTAVEFMRQCTYMQTVIDVYDDDHRKITEDARINVFLREFGEDFNSPEDDDMFSYHDICNVPGLLRKLGETHSASYEAVLHFLASSERGFLQDAMTVNRALLERLQGIDGNSYVDLHTRRVFDGAEDRKDNLDQALFFAQSFNHCRRLGRDAVELGWQPIDLANGERPDGVSRAWNPLWNRDGQVPNDHFQKPTMIITGSNMSGKSIYTTASLITAAAIQATGLAPAESGVYTPKGALMFMEKPDSNPGTGVSSFGAEALWWGDVLAKVRDLVEQDMVPAIWADEPFSSTDPEDQKFLIEAILSHLKRIGATVVMATHSDLTGSENHQDDFFHLATRTGGDGEPIYDYQLVEGHADSDALHAAERLGFSSDILARAWALWNEQEIDQLTIPYRQFPETKMPKKSFMDRLRGVNAGLSMFMGEGYGLPVDPHDISGLLDKFKESVKSRLPFDFSKRDNISSPSKDWDIESGILFFNGTSSPQEIIWRQEFFGALAQDEACLEALDVDFEELRQVIIALSDSPRIPNSLQSQIPRAYHTIKDWPGGVLGAAEEIIGWGSYDDILSPSKDPARLSHLYLNKIKAALPLFEFLSAHFADKVDGKTLRAISAIKKMTAICENSLEQGIEPDSQQVRVEDEDQSTLIEFLGSETWNRYRELRSGSGRLYQQWEAESYTPEELAFNLIATCEQVIYELRDVVPQEPLHRFDGTAFKKFRSDIDSYTRPAHSNVNHRWFGNDPLTAHVLPVLDYLSGDSNPATRLVEKLGGLDSLYAQQMANHFSALAEDFFDGHVSGSDHLAHLKKMADDNDGLPRYERLSYGQPVPQGYGRAGAAFDHIRIGESLVKIASRIKSENMHAVALSGNGASDIKGAWLPRMAEDKRVTQNITSNNSVRAKVFEGPNMSGKTSALKAEWLQHVNAQSTGYSPAEQAMVPVYDKLIYLDRVPAEDTEGLSSFGTEISNWNDMLAKLEGAGPSLVALDEPFSSTNARYQSILLQASLQHLIEAGHTVLLSTHNHQAMNEFVARNPAAKDAVDFQRLKTEVSEDGEKVTFRFEREAGRAPSLAIPVVRQMGGKALRTVIDEYLAEPGTTA